MTNEELKKKIVEILDNNIRWQPYYYISRGIVYEDDLKNIADALIASGYGDVKELKELKVELRDKVDYIHEQDEIIKEYKRRALVAERALKRIAHYFANYRDYYFLKNEREKERYEKAIFEDWINQAKEELADEGKDGKLE